MAKKSRSGPNKSLAIRDYVTAHPQATAQETVDALGNAGIKIKAQLFYNVKAAMGAKKSTGKRRGPKTTRGSRAAKGPQKVSMDSLVAAKKLADAMGGIEKARFALEALQRLAL